jgi:hypothetical protein
MISGELMFDFQEIILNGFFEKDYSLWVAGRGCGKSYLLSVFGLLYAIFYPGSKIVLVSANFRACKNIFNQMEKFINSKGAVLLKQCFPDKPTRQNDYYALKCANGSIITALPLGVGENLRGTRANLLIIDEGLLISEHIQETILRPFLTAKHNVKEQIEIKELEDSLIASGELKEEDRTVFPNNKMIICSSASYQFEYLYKIYTNYIDNIEKYKAGDPTYFVARTSYESLPEGTILDESVIKAASNGGANSPVFLREYCARFTDSNDGYFDVKKLHDCTIPDGDTPTVQLRGKKNSEYILAIDPSYSASASSDYFAMGLYMVIPEERRIIQVHSYGRAGKDLKDHYLYLSYVLLNFNIVYAVIDASGTEFLDGYNESQIAKSYNLNVGFIKADFESEDYPRELVKAKNSLNKEARIFFYPQQFNSGCNRKMNEYLQSGIAAKKIWFGSRINAHEKEYALYKDTDIPPGLKDDNDNPYSIVDFIDDQDDWVGQTKKQLALIEVKSTALGTLQFDLPAHLKRSNSIDKARRDNYTCLLMAYYVSRHYFDIMSSSEETQAFSFSPFIC